MSEMVRPRRCRWIYAEPRVSYFKPAGIPRVELEDMLISVEEYEAIRLKDLEGIEQEEAARRMGISQPTFHRLIISARKKVADAITNGKALRIQGGNYTMEPRRGRGYGGPPAGCVCPSCSFEMPKQPGMPCAARVCPKCGARMVRR